MIHYNGKRYENEWMHPEIKRMYQEYNPADMDEAMTEMGIHPQFAEREELDALRERMESAEVAF